MNISPELQRVIQDAQGIMAPYLQEVAAEQIAYDAAITDMGFLTGVPDATIRTRFRTFVESHPHDWRTYWAWFKSGDREVWEALRNG